MSWALPLPAALQRRVWAFKTQHPLAKIATQPMDELVAQGGYSTVMCEGCTRAIRFYCEVGPTHCNRCCWDDFIISNFPEYLWDPMWGALDELGTEATLREYMALAERILWAHR
jgi:hypothetical protein